MICYGDTEGLSVGAVRIAWTVILVGFLSACEGAQPVKPSPTSTPLAYFASQYEVMVDPVNAAYSELSTILCFNGAAGCSPPTMASVRPLFQRYQSLLTNLSAQLPTYQARLPLGIQSDLAQLRQAIATEITDLDNVVADTNEAQFWTDEERWAPETFRTGSAAQLVRADLHLTGG